MPSSVPFDVPGCIVEEVVANAATVTVVARAAATSAPCPLCVQSATKVHSSYTRAPYDLPVSEQGVRLILQVRRFFCRNAACGRRTFAERFPDLVAPSAQRTQRLVCTLNHVTRHAGGAGGSRLTRLLRMPASAATLLRLLARTPLAPRPTPRVLGVDDFALRKGATYGTLLVDLEAHRIVDMLPGRDATTLADWLQAHPGVEVITRDRSTEYKRGATAGAPQALQVADRWHLYRNVRHALQRALSRLRAELKQLPLPPEAAGTGLVLPRRTRHRSRGEQAEKAASRAYHEERYDAVQALRAQGVPLLQIAKRLQISRSTVHKYVAAARFPERATHHFRRTILDPYEAHLHQRFEEGCRNALQLWREIRAQGFAGSARQVSRWVQQRREMPAATTPRKHRPVVPPLGEPHEGLPALPALPAARQLAWLLVRPLAQVEGEERLTLARIRQAPAVEEAYQLAQQFCAMLQKTAPPDLLTWIERCQASSLPDLQTFATGLALDHDEVAAALVEPWSNGQLEGQIHRLKLIKRAMYGRASFDLLRRRVMMTA